MLVTWLHLDDSLWNSSSPLEYSLSSVLLMVCPQYLALSRCSLNSCGWKTKGLWPCYLLPGHLGMQRVNQPQAGQTQGFQAPVNEKQTGRPTALGSHCLHPRGAGWGQNKEVGPAMKCSEHLSPTPLSGEGSGPYTRPWWKHGEGSVPVVVDGLAHVPAHTRSTCCVSGAVPSAGETEVHGAPGPSPRGLCILG